MDTKFQSENLKKSDHLCSYEFLTDSALCSECDLVNERLSVSQFICLLGFRVCLCSIFSTTILIYLNQNNFIQNSEPNIHVLVHICPLEQQELCDGKAAAGVPVSNCGRDLQTLPHPAGHMTQGSESLASPPPPAMIQYGLVWR